MQKLILLSWMLCMHQIVFGQHFKISATQGLGLDANKKTDSLFFAKSYAATQLRLGYHYGKLGVILNTTYINQNDVNIADSAFRNDERIPIFLQSVGLQQPRKAADVQTLLLNLGLELCIPLAKRKAQMNLYACYGLGISRSDSVVFYDVNKPVYSHKALSKAAGSLQLGVSFVYKINTHVGIKWQNEFDCYGLPYTAVDIRKTPNVFTGMQTKILFISSVGAQYTF